MIIEQVRAFCDHCGGGVIKGDCDNDIVLTVVIVMVIIIIFIFIFQKCSLGSKQ